MKKIAILLVIILIISMSGTVFAKGGFDEFGYNEKARLFNGFYGYYDRNIEEGWLEGTYNSWLTMKWSKDWIAMADQPVGAWCTNHLIWYSNSYDEESWYGWNNRLEWNESSTPNVGYRIEEFSKLMKVTDDLEMWEEYQAAGAYSAEWGTYENGVPKYVVFQDSIEIYSVETGELVESISLIEGVNKGLGKPIF